MHRLQPQRVPVTPITRDTYCPVVKYTSDAVEAAAAHV